MKRSLLALAVVCLTAPALFSQESEEQLVQITPKQGGWEIEELFRTIAQYTGRSIVFDPASPEIRGRKIEFVGTQEVPQNRLFEWFQSLLSFQRLVLVPVGPKGHEQWMALGLNAPQITTRPIFVEENDIENWADRDGVYIVTTITVKHLTDTSRARNALAQLSTRQIGRINDVPGNLAFVVGDFAPVVASMFRLLRAMDKKPQEFIPIARTYPLVHAVASEVEPILSDLLEADPRIAGGRGARPQQGVPVKPAPRLIADTRQDAIIVYAVAEDQARIQELIDILDQEVHYKRGNIHFRAVMHTSATDLANILTELIRGTGLGSTPTRPGGRGAPATAGSLSGAADEPIIVADERSNSLLIQATATQLEDLDKIIQEIDVPRDQVLVEAALVELSVDDLIRFGVEFATATTQKDIDERTPFAFSQFGLSEIVDTDNDGIPDINIPAIGQGLTAGIYDNQRFPLLISALQSDGRAQALSIPSVVVEDGSVATMLVSDEEPYEIRSTDASGITSFAADFVQAEISLEISPHISSDNYLRLHIIQKVQSFGARISDTLPPPKTSREIETDIVIPDGYTVIMGGLIDEKVSETDTGIPYLRDIPVLGYLFGAESTQRSTTSLFLFVTPRILKQGIQGDFSDYHRITWERKLLADDLLQQAIDIYNVRFKAAEPARKEEKRGTLDEIQDTGFLDRPRYKSAPPSGMTLAEARRRIDEFKASQTASPGKKGE